VRIPRIYLDQPLSIDTEVTLDAGNVHYLTSVLRMKPGMSLVAFDGSGQEFHGTLEELSKKSGVARFSQSVTPNTESSLNTVLGIGISRGERMDYVVQKSTELGVNHIQPLFTEHCEVKLDARRAEKRRSHWQQVAISASEQSGRVLPPQVNMPATLDDWINSLAGVTCFLLDQEQPGSLDQTIKPSGIALLIGPEGGLSKNEKALALGKGFIGLNLGARVLRTETAPVAALSLFQYLWGN